MKLLLDTHTFLWFIDDSPMLSAKGKALLEADDDLLLSIGSLWEIAIELCLGKLTVAMPTAGLMTQQLTSNDIAVLSITVPHLVTVSTLPLHHRAPFDRLIIAQAMVEQTPIVSADPTFDAYSVERVVSRLRFCMEVETTPQDKAKKAQRLRQAQSLYQYLGRTTPETV
jgi:PIN domain nuclease of toxin-antitoxin system